MNEMQILYKPVRWTILLLSAMLASIMGLFLYFAVLEHARNSSLFHVLLAIALAMFAGVLLMLRFYRLRKSPYT